MHAYVTSRLDYANSLLYGINTGLIKKLQHVQNTAARVITGHQRGSSMKPILHSLHWLPVKNRIIFKLGCIVYKSKHNLAPSYLTELVHDYHRNTNYNLRRNSQICLKETELTTSSYGDRCFAIAAPKLWNSFPMCVKSSNNLIQFKKQLKTFLFNKSYEHNLIL